MKKIFLLSTILVLSFFASSASAKEQVKEGYPVEVVVERNPDGTYEIIVIAKRP